MNNNLENILTLVFSDTNLNRNEIVILLILKTLQKENSNETTVGLKTLMEHFKTSNKITIINTLKSLSDKSYIKILKTSGCLNTYIFIKDYLLESFDNDINITSDTSINPTTSDSNATANSTTSNLNTTANSTTSNPDTTANSTTSNPDTSNKFTASNIDTTDKFTHSKSNTSSILEPTSSYSSEPRSRINFIPTSSSNDIYNNNKYNNNNLYNNNLYINILNCWNNKKLGIPRSLNSKIINSMSLALSNFSEDEIISAINNYSEVFKSNFYYNNRWTLETFLTSPKGILKFCDNGSIWLSYIDSIYEDNEDAFDIEQYIDG